MIDTQGLTSPNDPLAHVKRDDPDPTQTHGQCECEAPLTDQRGSWLCTRELGHVGQHIAGCIDHVGAVWPGTDSVAADLIDPIAAALSLLDRFHTPGDRGRTLALISDLRRILAGV